MLANSACHFLCARCCSKCFTDTNALNSPNNTVRLTLLTSPVLQEEIEKLSCWRSLSCWVMGPRFETQAVSALGASHSSSALFSHSTAVGPQIIVFLKEVSSHSYQWWVLNTGRLLGISQARYLDGGAAQPVGCWVHERPNSGDKPQHENQTLLPVRIKTPFLWLSYFALLSTTLCIKTHKYV